MEEDSLDRGVEESVLGTTAGEDTETPPPQVPELRRSHRGSSKGVGYWGKDHER
jgi:hypothetical protein